MKFNLTILLILIVGMGCKKPTTYRYFEYGCRFTLDNGCVSTSQTTVKLTGAITFDEMKSNISNWVAPAKVKDIQVWYLREIPAGEMYVFTEKFSCKNLPWSGIDNKDTIKNTNNYITFKDSK